MQSRIGTAGPGQPFGAKLLRTTGKFYGYPTHTLLSFSRRRSAAPPGGLSPIGNRITQSGGDGAQS
jgi:hypothetical protein